ncbi:MAG: hypothetical protein ACXIUV_04730 [Alkalilacustris sp.]
MMGPLAFLARHGRWVLPLGLVAGIALPGLARAMVPAIVPLIVALLFLAALRIGPAAARPRGRELPAYLGLVLALQAVPPVLAIGVLAALGQLGSITGLGVVLVLAASPIVGSPGLAVLARADPVPALRGLVLGTALLPLTALPVLWLLPVFDDPAETLGGVGRLMAMILVAGGGAFALRALLPGLGSARAVTAIDGLTALGLALVVLGLTSALGPALRAGDPALWGTLALVCALNFGSQILVWAVLRGRDGGAAGRPAVAPAVAIMAGNRNLALFLGALPPETLEAMLLFVGCYQVPMYLTPLVMARLYRRVEAGG